MDLPHSVFWIPAQKGLPEGVKARIVGVFKTMHSLGIVQNTTETELDSILIDADLGIHIIDFQDACLRDDKDRNFDFAAEQERRRVEY